MVKSIGGKLSVCCGDVVRILEDPLLEVLLYFHMESKCYNNFTSTSIEIFI